MKQPATARTVSAATTATMGDWVVGVTLGVMLTACLIWLGGVPAGAVAGVAGTLLLGVDGVYAYVPMLVSTDGKTLPLSSANPPD